MAKQKGPAIEISGKTTEDAPVMKGLFRYHADLGLPLEDLLDMVNAKGWIVDWPDFVAGAKQDGWKDRTIVSKIVSACNEVYGKEHVGEVEKRLLVLLEQGTKHA